MPMAGCRLVLVVEMCEWRYGGCVCIFIFRQSLIGNNLSSTKQKCRNHASFATVIAGQARNDGGERVLSRRTRAFRLVFDGARLEKIAEQESRDSGAVVEENAPQDIW